MGYRVGDTETRTTKELGFMGEETFMTKCFEIRREFRKEFDQRRYSYSSDSKRMKDRGITRGS